LNKLILIGNVGRDPEMRITPSGQSVTSFSVASNRRYKTASGEQREETEWFNCQAWGKLAEVCNGYLTKGQQVYIEGRLKSRTYQTQNGETRFSNDVTVNELQFLGKRNDPASPDDGSATDDSQSIAEDRIDDLPWERASRPDDR
jgi:single-strand DNA-binding protein